MKKFDKAFSDILSQIYICEETQDDDGGQGEVNKQYPWETEAGKDKNDNVASDVIDKMERMLLWAKKRFFNKDKGLFTILQHLSVKFTYKYPTMAVDDKMHIFINPDFAFYMYNRNPDEVVGVLAHETMHHANETFARKKHRDHQLWNQCTDYIMNMYLLQNDWVLPQEGCIPTRQHGDRWVIKLPTVMVEDTAEAQEKIKKLKEIATGKTTIEVIEDLKRYGMLATETVIDITDMDAEQLYHYLDVVLPKQKKFVVVNSEPMDEHIEGDGEAGEGGDGEGGEKEGSKPGSKPGNKPSDKPGGSSDKQTSKELKDAIDNAKRATQEHKRDTLRGGGDKGGGGTRSLVGDWQPPKVDWRTILRRFITAQSDQYQYTWSRFNKRAAAAGYSAPGKRIIPGKVEAVIAVDSSGSISDATVRNFIGSVFGMVATVPDYNFRVIIYNDKIVGDLIITPSTLSSARRKLSQMTWRTGGNKEDCIREYLESQGVREVGGFLMLTDGYCDVDAIYPKSKTKRLFLLIHGGTSEHLKKHGDVMTININNA